MNALQRAVERWGEAGLYQMLTKKEQTWWAAFWKRRKGRRTHEVRQRRMYRAARAIDMKEKGDV